MPVTAKNPILPGFYPDPSICAVGEDYYIVNSSFAYYPGLPVLHSRDLAHWEQIGNVMIGEENLPLKGQEISRGLFAPTIRYNKGMFYVICTNVSYGGNYIVTATDPKGPWSEPHYIEGADGIDPSLFFDEDGKCYYIGTHPNPNGCEYDGDWYIYIQELDIKTFKFTGERKNVWNGAMKGIHWPEGPHLYKVGQYYYIMHAEGGTGPNHAICICRSRSVFGPYENNFNNPIFTHRHLGKRYPVQYVGHGDMFQTVTGDWYMVMLAVRPIRGFTTMGRETFLAKVFWEDGWPLVNPGIGTMTPELHINLEAWEPRYSDNQLPGKNGNYNFTTMKNLGPEVMSIRNPASDMYSLQQGKGLFLKCEPNPISSLENVSYLGIRQDSHMFEAKAVLNTEELNCGAAAGMMLMQSNAFHLRFEVSNRVGYVILCRKGQDEKLANIMITNESIVIILKVNGLKASILVKQGSDIKAVTTGLDISSLSTEVAGGFVGCTIGLFASDVEKRPEPIYANFASFSYNRLNPDEDEFEE